MEMMPLSEIILKKVKFGLTDAIDPATRIMYCRK